MPLLSVLALFCQGRCRTCARISAVLIHKPFCFAVLPHHLVEHDTALVTQNAENTVQVHPVLHLQQALSWQNKYSNCRAISMLIDIGRAATYKTLQHL